MLLTPRSGPLTSERSDYSLIGSKFSIRCFGGVVPSQLQSDSTNKTSVNIVYGVDSIMAASSMDLSNTALRHAVDIRTKVILTRKTQYYNGALATYIFKIIPAIFYQIGTKVIFEFPSPIAPLFNKDGYVECL